MELPRYKCHKVVSAVKIAALDYETCMLTPAQDGLGPFCVPVEFFRHLPKVGGYFVMYEDSYISYSPADAFESGYTRIS